MKLLCFLTLAFCATLSADPILYTNGPIVDTSQGWNISEGPGLGLSDSFTLTQTSTLTSVTFAEEAQSTPLTLEWSIGSAALGTDLGSAQNVPLTNTLYCTASATCGGGYWDVYTSTFSLNLTLGPGTYWLTLDSATGTPGAADPRLGWIQNNGPSSAYDGVLGTLESEVFEIDGTTVTPEPGTLALGGAGAIAIALLRRRLTC